MPPGSNEEKPSENLSAAVGLGITTVAALTGSAGLFYILDGLFSSRSPRLLAGLALAIFGTFLLVWVARRAAEWRLAGAATSAALGFFYSYRGKVDGSLPSERAAAATASLVLFIVAGVALASHLLDANRDD